MTGVVGKRKQPAGHLGGPGTGDGYSLGRGCLRQQDLELGALAIVKNCLMQVLNGYCSGGCLVVLDIGHCGNS